MAGDGLLLTLVLKILHCDNTQHETPNAGGHLTERPGKYPFCG